ncbi:Hypothetical predicted protein [Octopus vulgaris]|uniref:FLYWCH-type domain-containing protein n=1 Tax=Octopus vulgaris TaxID=6645 RepID=A0AA36FFB1_OCTVU|nr:Hypothetical predicted protein [Octopus vulgaris]
MESTIHFMKTTLCYNGYYYTKYNSAKSAEDQKCSTHFILSRNHKVMKTSEHNQTGDGEKVHVFQALNKIKEKALTTSEKPAGIISDATSEVPKGSQPLLPTNACITQNI